MTQATHKEINLATVSEEALADYLDRHPDFFERHNALLARLRLPHQRGGGATISLVERQVQALREQAQLHEARLKEFILTAQANDVLSGKIHQLACRLIQAHGAAQVFGALEASLREDFQASHWSLLCLRTDVPELSRLTTRHLRLAEKGAAELKPFDTFFEAPRPRCGQIRDSQRQYLFGQDAAEIGSAALMPLGPNAAYGLLAVGSNDTDRFHPTMSTDFLTRIGDLVSAAIGGL